MEEKKKGSGIAFFVRFLMFMASLFAACAAMYMASFWLILAAMYFKIEEID